MSSVLYIHFKNRLLRYLMHNFGLVTGVPDATPGPPEAASVAWRTIDM
jgi:hypothetical protein